MIDYVGYYYSVVKFKLEPFYSEELKKNDEANKKLG
jgi:hypothetical protein